MSCVAQKDLNYDTMDCYDDYKLCNDFGFPPTMPAEPCFCCKHKKTCNNQECKAYGHPGVCSGPYEMPSKESQLTEFKCDNDNCYCWVTPDCGGEQCEVNGSVA